MSTLKDKLRRSLEGAYRKSRWHSVKGALKGLSEEDAQWRPTHYRGFPWASGSIREIVFHVGACKLVEISSAFGDRSLDYDAAAKLPEAQSGTLAGVKEILDKGHRDLMRTLEGLSEEDLRREVRIWEGATMTAEQFFDMLIEHDLYHAGQIRYIRNLIEGDKE